MKMKKDNNLQDKPKKLKRKLIVAKREKRNE
jgi:hypothetical protein